MSKLKQFDRFGFGLGPRARACAHEAWLQPQGAAPHTGPTSLCLDMDGFSRQAKRPRLRVARAQPSDAALVSGLPPLETLEEVLALPLTNVNALVNYAETTNRMEIIDAFGLQM